MTSLTANDIRCFLLERFSAGLAARGLSPSDVGEECDLIEAGVVDSLGLIEMISAVEQHFKITVDFEPMDPEDLTLLGKFSHFVANNAINSEPRP